MTKENIIRMAREAEFGEFVNMITNPLERFAALVAAYEREGCAKVCEAGVIQTSEWDASYWNQACEDAAFRIRARGEK